MISVLMPTYGRREFVARALRVFDDYRYPYKELIICDDSPELLQLNQPHVRVIQLQERAVLGDKHNLMAAAAQGEILACQDDDDLFLPNRLARQAEPIACEQADLTGYQMRDMWNYDTHACYRFGGRVRVMPGPQTTGVYLAKFHDSTVMFSRKVWEAGLQFTRKDIFEKADLINDAVRAGFRALALENHGDFIYGRHGQNTWKIDRQRLVKVPTPLYVTEQLNRYQLCAN